VSPDALDTRAHLVLPDLDDGLDNHNNYLDHRQNQNNDMSFTHLLSSRRAWTKGRAEPEGGKLFQNARVLPILLITSDSEFSSDSTLVKRFKQDPQFPLGVLFYLWLNQPCV
jgi:hypothetical protein